MDKTGLDVKLVSNEALLTRLTGFMSYKLLRGGERQKAVIMGGILSLAFRYFNL